MLYRKMSHMPLATGHALTNNWSENLINLLIQIEVHKVILNRYA
jgi:hypothetical protein